MRVAAQRRTHRARSGAGISGGDSKARGKQKRLKKKRGVSGGKSVIFCRCASQETASDEQPEAARFLDDGSGTRKQDVGSQTRAQDDGGIVDDEGSSTDDSSSDRSVNIVEGGEGGVVEQSRRSGLAVGRVRGPGEGGSDEESLDDEEEQRGVVKKLRWRTGVGRVG